MVFIHLGKHHTGWMLSPGVEGPVNKHMCHTGMHRLSIHTSGLTPASCQCTPWQAVGITQVVL